MRLSLPMGAVFCLAFLNPAWAQDFTGSFTGLYGVGWISQTFDNPNATVGSSAQILAGTLRLDGATSANQAPSDPASIINYTHVVEGSGPASISFTSLFFAENIAHSGDTAAFLENGSVVQTFTIGVEQSFSFNMLGGQTFGFQLTSDNDNFADTLQISQVPEPSVAGLAVCGGLVLAFTWTRRRHT